MAQNQASVERDLANFASWAEKRDSVRAMILTSTFAIPGGPVDALSDYDLILALTDIRPFFDDGAWLSDFGPVLAVYQDPILHEGGFETSANITQYENGLKIDFTLWPVDLLRQFAADPQLPPEFDAGYRVPLDKDDLTVNLKPPTYKAYIPTPPTEAEYRAGLESFLIDATYVAKLLWRDDLVAAKHVHHQYMRHEHLLRMLEWHAEIRHGWSVKPGPYGRRLKKWLDPALWADLEKTYVGAGLEENWEAMFNTIALMRRVATEVANALGFTYPLDLEQRVVAYMRRVKDLDRNIERLPWRD